MQNIAELLGVLLMNNALKELNDDLCAIKSANVFDKPKLAEQAMVKSMKILEWHTTFIKDLLDTQQKLEQRINTLEGR